ncbi:MAG: hypothetical protein E6J03_01650 [Chloroflexi bacterium]|nr:MAG: hypothetical protein E6J03_01650 [Chloroflexota bacterium]
MTFVTMTITCARRRGALAAALVLAGVAAAIAPWVPAAARSGSSHHGSHGSGSGGQGGAAAPAPPGGPVNWLTSADGTLHTAVGVYSDCTGAAPVPTDMAAVDTCVRGRTYFVGHNQGVFTPLMHLGPGSLITWYDARGAVHRYRVVAVRDTAGGAHPLTTTSHRVDAQFQTCALANGSVDRILDAVRA